MTNLTEVQFLTALTQAKANYRAEIGRNPSSDIIFFRYLVREGLLTVTKATWNTDEGFGTNQHVGLKSEWAALTQQQRNEGMDAKGIFNFTVNAACEAAGDWTINDAAWLTLIGE